MLKNKAQVPKRGWKRISAGGFDPKGDHRIYEPQENASTPKRVYLKPIIDKTLTKCARENVRSFLPAARDGEPRKKFVIHPSQLGGCMRKAFFSFVHAEKDEKAPDPRLQRVFDVGHEGHRRIQGYFFEAWKRGFLSRVWEDIKLKIPELCISGELDSIVQVHDPEDIHVEIKTSKSTVFSRLKKPQETWVWQSHVYMKAVGIRATIILVECKDTQDQKEFWVPFDDNLWKAIKLRCLSLIMNAHDQEVPLDRDLSACRFCDYTRVCDDGAGIDWDEVMQEVVFP